MNLELDQLDASQTQPLSCTCGKADVCIAGYCERVDADRLRELGLIEGRLVRIITGVDPIICAVGRARVALARRLADGILVRLVHAKPGR